MKYYYLLHHNDTKMYLKYLDDIDYKHYVRDCSDATRFTLPAAKKMRKKFKHPENWAIVRVKESCSYREYVSKKNKRRDKNVFCK